MFWDEKGSGRKFFVNWPLQIFEFQNNYKMATLCVLAFALAPTSIVYAMFVFMAGIIYYIPATLAFLPMVDFSIHVNCCEGPIN